MDQLRAKWCEDLEDILQCPVCFYCRVDGIVHQCPEGHHICHVCKLKYDTCPSCKNIWTPYRNRVADNLLSKFEEIKESLIDPVAEINKIKNPKLISTVTQTDHVEDDTGIPDAAAAAMAALIPSLVPITSKPLPDGHSGPYPCCIDNCAVKMGFNALMVHIKTTHPMHFVEIPLKEDDLLFQHCWTFDYTEDLTFDRVFQITHIGTFILKICTDKCGDLTGYIMMMHCAYVSKQFQYQLKMSYGGDQSYPPYTGTVHSCRSPASVFNGKCLIVKNADIRKIEHQDKMLKCTLMLSRKMDADDVQIPKAMGQNRNKRHRNNRNKVAKASMVNAPKTATDVSSFIS